MTHEPDDWSPVGAVIPTKTVRKLISALLAECERADADHERQAAEDRETELQWFLDQP
jgi:hypothetical protein